jgi:hypothetical protein
MINSIAGAFLRAFQLGFRQPMRTRWQLRNIGGSRLRPSAAVPISPASLTHSSIGLQNREHTAWVTPLLCLGAEQSGPCHRDGTKHVNLSDDGSALPATKVDGAAPHARAPEGEKSAIAHGLCHPLECTGAANGEYSQARSPREVSHAASASDRGLERYGHPILVMVLAIASIFAYVLLMEHIMQDLVSLIDVLPEPH